MQSDILQSFLELCAKAETNGDIETVYYKAVKRAFLEQQHAFNRDETPRLSDSSELWSLDWSCHALIGEPELGGIEASTFGYRL